MNYPRLTAGVREEVHFAEVISAGDKLLIVGPRDGIHIRAIRTLGPNPYTTPHTLYSPRAKPLHNQINPIQF